MRHSSCIKWAWNLSEVLTFSLLFMFCSNREGVCTWSNRAERVFAATSIKKPNKTHPKLLDARKQVNGNVFNTALLLSILLTMEMPGMLVPTAGLQPAAMAWGRPGATAVMVRCCNLCAATRGLACSFTPPHRDVDAHLQREWMQVPKAWPGSSDGAEWTCLDVQAPLLQPEDDAPCGYPPASCTR